MKRTYILLSIAVGIVLLLVVSEVRAQFTSPFPPDRDCTAGSLATVIAGPCLSASQGCTPGTDVLAPDFPRLVNCPDECNGAALTGQFLRWDIQFKPLGKISPSLVGVQVSSDIQIEAAPGGYASTICSQDSELQVGRGDCDSRWIKFSGNNATWPYLASYFTQTGLGVRPEGVVVKSGSSIGTCLLAGAGAPSGLDPNQPITTGASFDTPGCNVSYNVDPKGRVIWGSVIITPSQNPDNPDCVLTESLDPLYISHSGQTTPEPALFHGGPITWAGSCRYCVANCSNTAGGATYITCTSCCVDSRTNKCVLRTSIPAGYCKPGT